MEANFTAPGQKVTYVFYAYNAGKYDAYLTDIIYEKITNEDEHKKCTKTLSEETTTLIDASCDDINMTVTIGTITALTTKSGINNHVLKTGNYEQITIDITYLDNGDRADEDFKITFGDISLNYTTTLPKNEITFFINSTCYKGIEGMTWTEWIGSDYNPGEFTDADAFCTMDYQIAGSSTYLSDGEVYLYGSACVT